MVVLFAFSFSSRKTICDYRLKHWNYQSETDSGWRMPENAKRPTMSVFIQEYYIEIVAPIWYTFFFFCNQLLCCNNFEEQQTMFFEVELIINIAPLTCFYPNTIKTCLTPNHLLSSRQLLYSSNTIFLLTNYS